MIAKPDTRAAVRFLDTLFARTPVKKVAFCLWDGTLWPSSEGRAATILLKHPGALRAMFEAGTDKALAEAYLRDDFDILGDVEAAFELTDSLALAFSWQRSLALAFLLMRLPKNRQQRELPRPPLDCSHRQHSLRRDQRAIGFHYDVSNEFYNLWLDQRMIYSCAYFNSTDRDLESAQTEKLAYLCRKLRLQAGQDVLDVGCGWGGFVLYAAQNCKVKVTGVTLSREQSAWAVERISAADLGESVNIRCEDYRALGTEKQYDAIVSVGMSEHVGIENLSGYFCRIWGLLKPGGVFLNHAIGEGCRYRPSRGPSFIDEYVFPDSDIPPIEQVLTAAANAGFEVRDVENLREHYSLTLRHWVRRLESNHGKALAIVGDATYRVWRLYMAGSAHGFAQGRLAVYQVLLSKPDVNGRSHLPLTRQDWYPSEHRAGDLQRV